MPDNDTTAFLDGSPFAVVGASTSRDKYGNKALRVYMQNDRSVYPVNPRAEEIEGLRSYPDLMSLPEKPHGVSIVTPPKITEQIVDDAIQLGIEHLWMQPGAESPDASARARRAGINVIDDGSCVLVALGFEDKS